MAFRVGDPGRGASFGASVGASFDAQSYASTRRMSWSMGDAPPFGALGLVKLEPGIYDMSAGEDAAARELEQLCRVQRLLFTSLPVSSSLLPQALGSRSRARSFSTVLFPLRAPGACSSPRSR